MNLTIGSSIIQGRVNKSIYPHRGGMILSHFPSKIHPDPNPPQLMQSMICQIVVSRGLGKGFKKIKAGFNGLLLCHTAKLQVVITEILSVDDVGPIGINRTDPNGKKELLQGQIGKVRIEPWCIVNNRKWREKAERGQRWSAILPRKLVPERSFYFDTKESCPEMSRFVLSSSWYRYHTGVILEYNQLDNNNKK